MNKKVPNRYELAYRKLWNELPNWKRKAILEDQASSVDSSVVQAFVKAVISLAENIAIKLSPLTAYEEKVEPLIIAKK